MLATRYTRSLLRKLDAQQKPRGVFDGLFYLHEERHRFLAVDEAMVVAECQIHHRPDDDLAVHRDGTLVDRVQTENRALRWVDDRRGKHRAENASIGNREDAAFQIGERDLGFARTFRGVTDG